MAPPAAPPPARAEEPRRAAGGVVAGWVRLVVTTVVGVAQAPVLFAHVPPVELGVWYLLFPFATFISLSDLGLPSTVARAVSYLRGSEAAGQRGKQGLVPSLYRGLTLPHVYAAALIATLGIGLAFVAVSLPAALLYFARALPPGSSPGSLLGPMLLFLLGAVLNLTAAIPAACLSGSGDVTLENAVRTAASAIGFGLVVLVVPIEKSLLALCGIYAIQGAIALAGGHLLLVARRGVPLLPALRLDARLVRGMYTESAAIFVSRLGHWLTLESTLLLAGRFLGPEAIPDFALLRQLVVIGTSITAAIPLAVSPQAAAAHAAGDRGQVESLYRAALRYTMAVNVLWTAGVLLWAQTVIGLLVGSQHFVGHAVLVPLALASLAELHAGTHAAFVWQMGRWPFAPWVLGGGVLNVAFGAAGCAAFGLPGLAWGSFAAQALTTSWVQVAHGLRQIAVGFGSYLRETLAPAGAYAAALAATGGAVRVLLAPFLHGTASAGPSARLATAGFTLFGVVCTTLLAALFAWVFVLTPGDRTYFLRLARIGR